MSDAEKIHADPADMSNRGKRTWSEGKLAFEVWKFYGGIGGADKDQMIKIVTWLLAFSAGIIGLQATENVEMWRAKVLLSLLGMLISFLAAYTALLYGGYAARNWAIADRIAEAYEWEPLKPDYKPFEGLPTHWSAALPLWLARPCTDRIAPVFWVFCAGSVVSLSVHAVLLYLMVR